MVREIVAELKNHNEILAQQLLGGKIMSDAGPRVSEGDFFTVSSDHWLNYLIFTGFNGYWPNRFITHMERKLETYVTTVFRWEGERGEYSLVDISDVMMNQVYERMK